MNTTTLNIKNMCCERCIIIVKGIFEDAGFLPQTVSIGEVVVNKTISQKALNGITKRLEEKGFSLAISADEKLVVNIQSLLANYLNGFLLAGAKSFKLSTYLSKNLYKSYTQLSKLFKHATGVTIEKYFIRLKIEKAKEILILGEMDIVDIAWLLGYSTSQNFSTQFKKETGKSPGEYKKNPKPGRIHLSRLLTQNFKQ